MNALHTEKNLLLIRKVDDLLDFVFSPQDTQQTFEGLRAPGWAYKSSKGFAWLANRMRYAWHAHAQSHLYAYCYKTRDEIEPDSKEEERVVKAILQSSVGRKNDWIENPSLVKVGVSLRPAQRRKGHLSELYRRFPEISGSLQAYCCLLLLPCRNANAAEYLEAEVLNSLPKEDLFYNEWFHDTIGVARTLCTWFCAARYLYLHPNKKGRR